MTRGFRNEHIDKGRVIGERNREAVREYFLTHPCCTQKECSSALRLSIEAVGRHVKSIRAEWLDDNSTEGEPNNV